MDEQCLAHLDYLEHHPKLYERMTQEIQLTGTEEGAKQIVSCDVYFIVQYQEKLLELPMFSCYTDGINGNKFIMPDTNSSEGLPLHEIHKGYEKRPTE